MKQLTPWLGAAGILVVIFGTLYAVVQQAQRNDANFPQIQLAEDVATGLDQGLSAKSQIGSRVDLNHSLAPFLIIYDKQGKVVAGSGYLNGHIPVVPIGVLSAATGNAYHHVTWQPQADVRIAAVTVSAQKYYVLSGRSLREVEVNEQATLQNALLGGLASLLLLGATYLLTGTEQPRAQARAKHK